MIAIKRADGGVSILAEMAEGAIVIDEVAKWEEQADPSWLPIVSVVEVKSVPDDRTYRNAWVLDENYQIVPDMDKARSIHRDLLRAARITRLEELDVAYQRADEVGDLKLKESIASEKQRLRAVTADPAIDKAETIDDLKLLTLDALLGETVR